MVYVCGVAVGPIGGGVGATKEGVNLGIAAAVVGSPRSTAVARGVCVTMGAGAATHALNVVYSAAAALSARSPCPQPVLISTL